MILRDGRDHIWRFLFSGLIKVIEAYTLKQPIPQGNFKNLAKTAADNVDIKGLLKSTFDANLSSHL